MSHVFFSRSALPAAAAAAGGWLVLVPFVGSRCPRPQHCQLATLLAPFFVFFSDAGAHGRACRDSPSHVCRDYLNMEKEQQVAKNLADAAKLAALEHVVW